MPDFGLYVLCSTSGQTCSSSAVVRPQPNEINHLEQKEVEHVRPLVRPLFVLETQMNSACYADWRTNNESPHTTYGEANRKVWPLLPYVEGDPRVRALTFPTHSDPTTAAGTAKHQPPSSSTRAANQKRKPPMANPTLSDAQAGATPKMPMPAEPSRTILALDLGTTTGWALRAADGLITSGTASFRNGRFDGGGMRYLRFTNWLTEVDRLSGPIEAIYFEEVRRHIGTDAAHVFGGLLAVLTSWGELRGVPYQGVPVGTIKRHATGKGNASKQAMIDAVRERGFSPTDDNEADAIAILLWAIETQGGLA